MVWLVLFCVLFIVLWGVAGEILKNHGVSSGSAIGFIIGVLTALIVFRTGAVISKEDLDATIYDVLFWVACLGSWIYVGYVSRQEKVIPHSNQQQMSDFLLNGSAEKTEPIKEIKNQPKQPSGLDLFLILFATIFAFFVWGVTGLVVVIALSILWRIARTLEEIRDKNKE